ncbi:hypothetical protein ACOSP6_13190 [Tenacibaculum sp. MEBiC06402]|uniref:hypothetical protein n=1 Tax=unclassified Tenacibaculum TaxID=2635139 RepID=UPI003B999697
MKTNIKNISLIFLVFLGTLSNAQILDANTKFTFILSDDSEIVVYKKAASFDENSDEYYSLPSHLKFSTNRLKEPEFSLIKYDDANGNNGGILHFLTSWGLSLSQRKEVEKALEKVAGEDARFMGNVTPNIDNNHPYLQISGKTKLSEILNNSATSLGRITLFPNSKSASSFKLNSDETQTLASAINKNSKELKKLFLSMNFIIQFKGKKKYGLSKETYQLKENLHTLLNQ